MLDSALTKAAKAGGVPKGWNNDELGELAARHFLLALYAKDEAQETWHLRQHAMLLDLLETKQAASERGDTP